MANVLNLTASGLYTFQNYLSSVPQGALIRADNVVIDRDGVIEPARGFKQYLSVPDISARAQQLIDYKNRLLVHYSDKIAFDDGSAFQALSASYAAVASGLRIKSIEVNSNLYLTTDLGIRKIATSLTNPFATVEEDFAGGIKAIDIEAELDYTNPGFLSDFSKVSYRALWLRKDINDNLIIGYPSQSFEVTNTASKSCRVKVTVPIPKDILDNPDSHFFQIYRSNVFQAAEPKSIATLNEVTVSDEMRLVYEAYPTSTELIDQECIITDVASEDYRNGGTNLYTNEFSGEGIAQANFRPPICKDIAAYKNMAFFANTKTYNSLDLALTGFSGVLEYNITSITYVSNPVDPNYQKVKITLDSGLSSELLGKRIVVHGVDKDDPDHQLNDTFIVDSIVGLDIYIKKLDGSLFLSDPTTGADAPNDGMVFGSYIKITKGTTTEYYHLVGRQAKVAADYSLAALDGGKRIEFQSADGKTDYYAWYEKVTPAIKESINLSFCGSSSSANESVLGVTFDVTTDTVGLTSHGIANDTAVYFTDINNAVITGISNNTKYYVVNTSTNTFQISTALGGSPIGFSGTNSSGLLLPSLKNKYFSLNTATEAKYYIWYTVNTDGTDPQLLGQTGIKVNVNTGATKEEVALATYNALVGLDAIELQASPPVTGDFSLEFTEAGDVATHSQGSMPSAFVITVTTNGQATATSGIDPLITDRVSIKVSYETTDTIAQIIEKTINTIIENSYDFLFESVGTTLTFVTPLAGTLDHTQFSSDFGATFSLSQEGFGQDSDKKYVRWRSLSATDEISPSEILEDTARSLVSIINKDINSIADSAYESTSNDIPGKFSLEEREYSNDGFTVIASSIDFGKNVSPNIDTEVYSTNEISPNRIYYSKTREPEHVPKLNYIDIGPKDKEIIRIVGLQDSLFIFKEEGIYRLSGDSSANFVVKMHDNSGILIAPDSPTVLNNQIYCFTTQGIVAVSEGGMNIISRPIENLVLAAVRTTDFSTHTFGISSESDRALLMFVPVNSSDESATIAYRYNVFTRAWTTIKKAATCGVLNGSVDKFFLGAPDLPITEVERKTFSREDYAGREYDNSFINNSKVGNSISLSLTSNVEPGDIIVQTQYLTISQLNRLLGSLDLDPSIKDPLDLFYALKAESGDDLNSILLTLVDKLNTRVGTPEFTYATQATFVGIQTEFNSLVDQLNASPNVFFTNYEKSEDTVKYEFRISTVNYNTNVVSTQDFLPIIAGACVVHKSLPVDVIYAPQHFGDPSVLKHIRESTIMFEDTSFEGGLYGFNSDLSADYEMISFTMTGDGLWGMDLYDTNPWGGAGMAVPFRTLIPRQKQRCRFIRARFQIDKAFTRFAILGASFVFESTSERAYK